MSLHIGQIFVRTDNFAGLSEFVRARLERWFKEAYEPLSVEERMRARDSLLIDDEGVRSIILLPPHAGWQLLLERVSDRVDLSLARSASADMGCTVVCVELDGSAYRRAHYVFQGGTLKDWKLEPLDGFDARYRAPIPAGIQWPDRSRMPVYSDVESDTLAALGACGVPADLAFLSHDMVTAGGKGSAEAMFFKAWQRDEGPAFRHYEFPATFDPAVREGRLPLVFDHAELKTDISQQLAVETRRVYGAPSEAAVQSLVRLEDAFRLRALRRFAEDCSDEFLPDVEFNYIHESGDEQFARLLRQMKAAGRPGARALYHKALYSRPGFKSRVASMLRQARPDWRLSEGPAFEVRAATPDGKERKLPLADAYQRYLQQPERIESIIAGILAGTP